MTTDNRLGDTTSGGDFEALDRALETYGADRTRWPLEVRHALSHLMATSPEAQRRLRQAGMFDRLLDQAPVASAAASAAARAALLERIMVAATHQPRLVHAPAEAPRTRVTPAIGWREHGFAAAALAASLVFGVIAGQTTALGPVAVALVTGVSAGSGGAEQQLAATDEAEGLLDEDLL